MTITEQKAFLKDYRGSTRLPEGFAQSWQAQLETCCPVVAAEPVDLGNPMGIYEHLTVSYGDRRLTARCIRPADGARHPLMLFYHDLNRGPRGWHHMTRFLAFGYGVVALEAVPFQGDWTKGEPNFRQRYLDALAVGKAAMALPWAEEPHVVTFGEGFGGGLALLAAAMLPGDIRCAMLNPMPGDFRGLGCKGMDMVDLVNFAPLCRGPVLLGTCLMDTYAPPKGQAAIYNNLNCEKQWKIYPKYTHERVNFFENAFVSFLGEGKRE